MTVASAGPMATSWAISPPSDHDCQDQGGCGEIVETPTEEPTICRLASGDWAVSAPIPTSSPAGSLVTVSRLVCGSSVRPIVVDLPSESVAVSVIRRWEGNSCSGPVKVPESSPSSPLTGCP